MPFLGLNIHGLVPLGVLKFIMTAVTDTCTLLPSRVLCHIKTTTQKKNILASVVAQISPNENQTSLKIIFKCKKCLNKKM